MRRRRPRGRDGRLRVAVPELVRWFEPRSGHWQVWESVLPELGELVELETAWAQPGPRGRRRRRDAWIVDGHSPIPLTSDPVVACIHELGWQEPDLLGLLDSRFVERLRTDTLATLERVDRLVVCSESTRRSVLHTGAVPAERIDVVPYGVDTRRFQPGIPGGAELVARARGGEPAPYVLHVATLHPRKNLGALREAMSELVADGLPHVLCIVATEAADRPPSAALSAQAFAELPGAPGRVVRVEDPTDDELAALMAGADAFCLPSLSEGFGLPALEALACGTPVVVSDRASLPEVVGDAGVVVEPTAAGLRDGLASVLTDPARAAELRAAGPERAAEFTWARTARGWHAALRAAWEARG